MKKYGLSFYDQVYGLFKQPLSTVWFELYDEIDKQALEEAVNSKRQMMGRIESRHNHPS